MSQKIASFFAEITANTQPFEQGLGKVKGSLQGLEGTIKSVLPANVTQFLGLAGAVTGVAAAMRASIVSTVQYADSVRELSQVGGTSIQESSRFIQVLDDYKISADDALVATRALNAQGYAPNIDTLAKLSDQYLSLNTAQEKNDFVLKNLGRSGLQWIDVLNRGSKAIRDQGAAVDKNLILTQKMVDDARSAEIAWDNWNDSIKGVETTFATGLLPQLTKVIDFFQATDTAFAETGGQGFKGMMEWGDAVQRAMAEQEKQRQSMLGTADASNTLGDSLGTLADKQKAAQDAAKGLSDVLTGTLSAMFDITRANQDYQQTLDDLTKSDADLAAQKNQLTLKMWEEQRAGKMTNDEYLRYVQQLDEVTQSQKENADARDKAAKDQANQANQRVFDLTKEKLAADGIIDTNEYNYLQNLAVAKGLVTKAAADQAMAENKQADQLVQNFSMTQPKMEASLATMQAIANFDGHVVNFGVNFTVSGASMNAALAGMGGTSNPMGYTPSTVAGYGSNTPNGTYHPINFQGSYHDMDSGGSGMAGTPYLVGTGAQPEMVIPNSNSTFIPNADKKGWGTTYNVVINNPRKETAENSIRRELKKLSYSGVAS